MPTILRDVPPGYDWGWYSREDPKIHLQVVDQEHEYLRYKVWLEGKEKRIFEPAGAIPARILKRLKAEVDLRRSSIEMKWVDLMISQGWLRYAVRGTVLTLIAYPNTPGRFEKTIDLGPHMSPEEQARFEPGDVGLNREYAVIELWPNRHESSRPFILIPPLLWKD